MNITLKNGTRLNFDPEQWRLSDNTLCEIVDHDELTFKLKNKNGIIRSLAKGLIYDNDLPIINNKVTLTPNLYNHQFIEPEKEKSEKRFNKLFNDNATLIFKNQDIVLTRAEYYLLQPEMFSSGGTYIGGFTYPLGALIESFKSGNHLFVEKFNGHKKLYMISTTGSPLSGICSSTWWSEDEQKIIYFSPGTGPKLYTFYKTLDILSDLIRANCHFCIDFQDIVFKQLLSVLSEK